MMYVLTSSVCNREGGSVLSGNRDRDRDRDKDRDAFRKLRALERYEEEREERGDDEDDDEDDDDEEETEGDEKESDANIEPNNNGVSTTASTDITPPVKSVKEWKVITDLTQIRKIVEYLGDSQEDKELIQNIVYSYLTEKKIEPEKIEKIEDKDKDVTVDTVNTGNSEEEDAEVDVTEPSDPSRQQEEEFSRPGRKVRQRWKKLQSDELQFVRFLVFVYVLTELVPGSAHE